MFFVQKNQEAKVSKKFSFLDPTSYISILWGFFFFPRANSPRFWFWLIAKNMTFEASTSFLGFLDFGPYYIRG
jgi:hypothetical protein